MAKVTGLRTWRNGEIINARDYVYERNQITTALNTNDDTLIDHETRITTAEGDITALEGRMTTAEADIVQLETDVLGLDNTKADLTYVNTHINNTSNPHAVTKAQVGLGNVTNESKATMFTSPALTGTPTAPTATASTNTTQIATTAYVVTEVGNLTNYVDVELDGKVNKNQTIIGIDLEDSITLNEFKTALGNATQSLAGLMSAADKVSLDNLVALLNTNDGDNVVDTIGEILQIFNQYPEGADLVSALNGKVDKIVGKGLSENDYTAAEVNKVSTAYAHVSATNNPHSITKAQVGLGNADNTSDANKPISTATQTALDAHTSRTDNPHSVTQAQVGLSNVNNTSDANKPVSTATQTALNVVERKSQNIIDLFSTQIYEVNNENQFPNVPFTTGGKHILAFGDIGDSLSIWKKLNNGSSQSLANWAMVASNGVIKNYIYYTPDVAFKLYRLYDPVGGGYELIPFYNFSFEDFNIKEPQNATAGGQFFNSPKLAIEGNTWEVVPTSPATYLRSSNVALGSAPQNIFFKPDGLTAFVADGSNILTIALTTAFDVSNTSITSTTSITNPAIPSIRGLYITDNGLTLFVLDNTARKINKYTLSTAWNISTLTLTTSSTSTLPSSKTYQEMFFKPDGLKVYIVDSTDDIIRELTLTSAYDVTSWTQTNTFGISAADATPTGLWFNPTGTKMFVVGTSSDNVVEYTLSTAWLLSSATITTTLAVQQNVTTGVVFNPNGTKMFLIGSTTDFIDEYIVPTPFSLAGGPPVEKRQRESFVFQNVLKANETDAQLRLSYRKVNDVAPIVDNSNVILTIDDDGAMKPTQIKDGTNSVGLNGYVLTKNLNGLVWANPNPNTTLTLTNPTFNLVGGIYEYVLTNAQIDNNDLIIITKAAEGSFRTYVVKVPNNSKQIRVFFTLTDGGFSSIYPGIIVEKAFGEKVVYSFNTQTVTSASCLVGDTSNYVFLGNTNVDVYYENKGGVQKMVFESYNSEI